MPGHDISAHHGTRVAAGVAAEEHVCHPLHSRFASAGLQKPEMAAGLTILFVLILPIIAFCVPTFVIDTVFIVMGSAKLLQELHNRSVVFARKPGDQRAMV